MGVGGGQLSPALPSAFMSRSVTFRDKKPVYLLQVETFVGGGNGDNGPFLRCGGDKSAKYRS